MSRKFKCQNSFLSNNQFSISTVFFLFTQLNVKTVIFEAIQFNISTQFSSIRPTDRNLSGATTPDQRGPRSDGSQGVHRIPQSSSITGASPSDCLMSYTGHSLEESYSSAEKQSVYSTAPVNSI